MSNLYAIEFSTGLVKVGRTDNVQKRTAEHARRLSVTGAVVHRQYSGKCSGSPVIAERELKRLCAESAGTAHTSEWFQGLSFAEVMGWIDAACAIPSQASQYAPTPVHEAMDVLGGTPTSMAAALGGGITRQNVEHWLDAGRVPARHAPAVEAETRERRHPVICEALCPGVRWDVLRLNPTKVPA